MLPIDERAKSGARLLHKLETLKRPEPSEAEREDKFAQWLCNRFAIGYSWDDADYLCRDGWRNKARDAFAALKAMEG